MPEVDGFAAKRDEYATALQLIPEGQEVLVDLGTMKPDATCVPALVPMGAILRHQG